MPKQPSAEPPQTPFRIDGPATAEKILMPVIRKGTTRGVKTELAALMRDVTGKPVTRQMVERWLHPDSAHRDQPSFANALMLFSAFKAHELGIRSAGEIRAISIELRASIEAA